MSAVLFDSFAEWQAYCASNKKDLHVPVLDYEQSQHGHDEAAVLAGLEQAYGVMREAVEEGLSKSLHSRSGMVQGGAKKIIDCPVVVLSEPFRQLVARSIAAKELNACMGRVVAAPTAGASGILPGVLTVLQDQHNLSQDKLLRALLVAGGVGMVIEHRASVAGAVGGCQAETGSAAAMAAAAIVYALGGDPTATLNAVAITIQCTLGLICDPVAGLVEVPCIVRNASAASIAFSSAQIALAEVHAVIPVDECVDAMAEVAQSMEMRYKETAEGGLANTPTGVKIKQIIQSRNK